MSERLKYELAVNWCSNVVRRDGGYFGTSLQRLR